MICFGTRSFIRRELQACRPPEKIDSGNLGDRAGKRSDSATYLLDIQILKKPSYLQMKIWTSWFDQTIPGKLGCRFRPISCLQASSNGGGIHEHVCRPIGSKHPRTRGSPGLQMAVSKPADPNSAFCFFACFTVTNESRESIADCHRSPTLARLS